MRVLPYHVSGGPRRRFRTRDASLAAASHDGWVGCLRVLGQLSRRRPRAGEQRGVGHRRRTRRPSSSPAWARATAPTTAVWPARTPTAPSWHRLPTCRRQPGRTWRAYLSAGAANGQPSVNARDRIGAGPWYNARGTLDRRQRRRPARRRAARSQRDQQATGAEREGAARQRRRRHAESARHPDRLRLARRAPSPARWTRRAATTPSNTDGSGSVMVGHHDRTGGGNTSWNSAHGSRGCSQPNLVATGGAGLLYCFAAN